MPAILIVDDERRILDLLRSYLSNNGYQVLEATDGQQALQIAQTARPDLVVLDWMLPELDGMEVCRRLRQQGRELPIIMLTARDDDTAQVVGLELGADDYVTKPFSPRELLARVRAVLRRIECDAPHVIYTVGDVTIDEDARQVWVAGQELPLRPKEFDLLNALCAQIDRVQTREQLLEAVWGYDFGGDTRTVDVHMARLRDKLKDSRLRIEAVRGMGYRLIEE